MSLPRDPRLWLLLTALLLACAEDRSASRTAANPKAPSPSVAEALTRTGSRAEPGSAAAGGQCAARGQPVVIRIVSGPHAVQARRSEPDRAPIVSADAETLVFANGYVVTSNLEGVGEHLGRLGWVDREIVLASELRSRGGIRFRRG